VVIWCVGLLVLEQHRAGYLEGGILRFGRGLLTRGLIWAQRKPTALV
jgi:hypothetical protein